ncbi:hypothetical protein QTN25_004957 [Entamoeba marina]
MHDGLQKVATTRNVIAAFRSTRIDLILLSGKFYTYINQKELTNIKYSEVFTADYFPLIYRDDPRKQVGNYLNNLRLAKLHFDFAP